LCPAEKRAVAWIQSFLELVYREGGCRAQSALLWRKESVGTQQRCGNMRRDREEPIQDMMKGDQWPTD
jgi:hypothetical protein